MRFSNTRHLFLAFMTLFGSGARDCRAQTSPWPLQFGPGVTAATNGDRGYSTAVDSQGNIYVTGYFYGTVHFQPPGATIHSRTTAESGAFLAKYNSSGSCLWVKSVGAGGWNGGYLVTVDGSNNVYLTGWFSGENVNFNPGGPEVRLSTAAPGCFDIFVAKYNSDGACQWARSSGSLGCAGGSDGVSVAVDGNRNVYVTGFFKGTAEFLPRPPGLPVISLTSAGDDDVFVAKYDEGGTCLWAKRIGGTETDHGRSIAVDAAANVYVGGSFKGSGIEFSAGGTQSVTHSSAGDADAFIAKYDSSGGHLWSRRMGGPGDDSCQQVALSAGSLYATGWFQQTADFAAGRTLTATGSYDVFLAAYNPDTAVDSY